MKSKKTTKSKETTLSNKLSKAEVKQLHEDALGAKAKAKVRFVDYYYSQYPDNQHVLSGGLTKATMNRMLIHLTEGYKPDEN